MRFPLRRAEYSRFRLKPLYLAREVVLCPPRAAAVLAVEGGEMVIGGERDAYGHQKLGGIGDRVGAEIKRITGHHVLVQRLAYLMRSGPPDSLDRLGP